MSRPVTVRIGPPRVRGTNRLLAPGQSVTLGRVVRGAGPERVNVPGRWMGVGRDAMVPDELLTLTYLHWSRGAATMDWCAGSGCDPSSLLFVAAPDAGSAPSGRLVVTGSAPARLVVSRMNVQTDRFVQRLVVGLELAGTEAQVVVGSGDRSDGPSVVDDVHDWGELVDLWWVPRKERGDPEALTWRTTLSVTFRLAGDAPQGRLARIVAQGLQRRGYPGTAVPAVSRAWGRATIKLCQVLSDPGRRWMLDALDLPRLTDCVGRIRAGVTPLGVPAGEKDVRALRLALRATGRPEWQ